MKDGRHFAGFGFGAIQAGLFLYEAFRSGNFDRLVVLEIKPEILAALRRGSGIYRVNVATPRGLEVHEIKGVEAFHPEHDRLAALDALATATEICTALPSVDFYPPIARLLAEGLRRPAIIYTAENHNHAAEILEKETRRCRPNLPACQFLNTVIGKMSGVVPLDPGGGSHLVPICDGLPQAFLVEEFNQILISRVRLPGFSRGLGVFLERDDLLPFEEAKLYGHNAVHALLGYLAQRKGLDFMSDAAGDDALMQVARGAFLEESRPALLARHTGLDPLFTPEGYAHYAEDLLTRMTNPFLSDRIDRVVRDTPRKLGWDDRLVGTMRLALDAGIEPVRFALGVAAAWETVPPPVRPIEQLDTLWPGPDRPPGRKAQIVALAKAAQSRLPVVKRRATT